MIIGNMRTKCFSNRNFFYIYTICIPKYLKLILNVKVYKKCLSNELISKLYHMYKSETTFKRIIII